MSYPVWPEATIPHRPEYNGYGSSLLPTSSSFKPDIGLPTTWRRSTLDARKIQSSFVWTTAQRDAFYTFYNTTLKNGTKVFYWDNPALAGTGRYQFDVESPPREEAIGFDMWRVSVSVYRLGDA
jgi:hypothetical protein